MKSFFERVYEQVARIPYGKVTTYGEVARAVGAPKCSRQVGFALHSNPKPIVIPCHRVVFKNGSLTCGFAFGGAEVQRALLEGEGVKFTSDGKVDMEKFFVSFNDIPAKFAAIVDKKEGV